MAEELKERCVSRREETHLVYYPISAQDFSSGFQLPVVPYGFLNVDGEWSSL